jgi:hypothetical protein
MLNQEGLLSARAGIIGDPWATSHTWKEPSPPARPRSKWVRPVATAEQIAAMVANLPFRISNRIWVCQRTGCWLWAGSDSGSGPTGHGYGRVSVDGETWAIHIYMYTQLFGPIKGKRRQLDHECRTRNCCNPEHLEAVTHKMNCKRRDKAMRARRRLVATCDAC